MKKNRVRDMETGVVANEGLAEEVVLVPGQGTSKCKGPEAARARTPALSRKQGL